MRYMRQMRRGARQRQRRITALFSSGSAGAVRRKTSKETHSAPRAHRRWSICHSPSWWRYCLGRRRGIAGILRPHPRSCRDPSMLVYEHRRGGAGALGCISIWCMLAECMHLFVLCARSKAFPRNMRGEACARWTLDDVLRALDVLHGGGTRGAGDGGQAARPRMIAISLSRRSSAEVVAGVHAWASRALPGTCRCRLVCAGLAWSQTHACRARMSGILVTRQWVASMPMLHCPQDGRRDVA